MLSNLEKSQTGIRTSILGGQMNLFAVAADQAEKEEENPVLEEIKALDTNSMTPLDALTKLAELKGKLEGGE
mgnify:CR=1 FL=1